MLIRLVLAGSIFFNYKTFASETTFKRKGEDEGYFSDTLEAFDISVLGEMLLNFYYGIKNEATVFAYLMNAGDQLLLPILGPLIIVCSSVRFMQEMNSENKDIFVVVYATGTVVLMLTLYRIILSELTAISNALAVVAAPADYSFQKVMQEVEGTVTFFEQSKRNKDPIAVLVDKSVSMYTEYFMAWGSKWGVLVLHALLSYLRNTLYAINYILGIFLLPFFIIKQNSLPRNWIMITSFILLWGIVENIMVSVMGQLGIGALNASLQLDKALPIFSESLFYVMVTTVNLLIGVAMLSSVWIVKSYLMSPTAISTATALFTLPAVSLARMASGMASTGALVTSGMAKAAVSGTRNQKRSTGYGRYKGGLPPLYDKSPKKTADKKINKPIEGLSTKKDSPINPTDLTIPRRNYKMRTLLEHTGKLDSGVLPANVVSVSRVGKKNKINTLK